MFIGGLRALWRQALNGHCVLAQADPLRLVVRAMHAGNVYLFHQHQAFFRDQHFFHHWNDKRVAFIARLRYFGAL